MSEATVRVPVGLMREVLEIVENRYNHVADSALIVSPDGLTEAYDDDSQEELDDLADMLADINFLMEGDAAA